MTLIIIQIVDHSN